jgi:tRNA(fMet)-specific endonuclease VapC
VKRYMLDTNIVSLLIRRQSTLVERVQDHLMSSLCVSAITAGELAFGLARRPEATRLKIAVAEFLLRVDVLPWDGAIAEAYGVLRARMEIAGKNLAPLDRLIAAHALGEGTVLVTNDRAFGHVPDLQIEDWTTPTPS